MEKILVNVRVAALEKNYDVWIPTSSLIKEITLLMSASFADLSNGTYEIDDKAILCSLDNGKTYSPDMVVNQIPIVNGEHLLLI